MRRAPMSGNSVRVAAVLVGVMGLLFACGAPPHRAGVVVQDAGACAACHMGNYDATTSPPHASTRFPTTCGSCHTTVDWNVKGHVSAATEAAFTVTSGIHAGIACMDCHDASTDSDFKTNANCTASCHTASNTEGYDSPAPAGVSGWKWANVHNGSKSSDFTSLNPNSPYPLQQFCRNCHPQGQLASAQAVDHGNPFETASSFNKDHKQGEDSGATHTCLDCHNPIYDPPVSGALAGQRDYSQDVDCGNTCHQHAGSRVGQDGG